MFDLFQTISSKVKLLYHNYTDAGIQTKLPVYGMYSYCNKIYGIGILLWLLQLPICSRSSPINQILS